MRIGFLRSLASLRFPGTGKNVLSPTLTRPAGTLSHPLRRRDSAASPMGEGWGEGNIFGISSVSGLPQHPALGSRSLRLGDPAPCVREWQGDPLNPPRPRACQIFTHMREDLARPFTGPSHCNSTGSGGLRLGSVPGEPLLAPKQKEDGPEDRPPTFAP